MKNLILLITFLVCMYFESYAQRIVELVTPATTQNVTEVAIGNVAYFAPRLGDYLQSYDGTAYREFTYPVRDGVQLVFRDFNRNIMELDSKLYIVLGNQITHQNFVYRFDGSHFEPVLFPGDLMSNIVIYKSKITAVMKNSSTVKLFACDGSAPMEVSSELIPLAESYQLMSGRNLYIRGIASPTFMMRFNGSSFLTLPTGVPDMHRITDCFQVIGSDDVYFVFDDKKVEYFNGVTMTEIFVAESYYTFAPIMWRGTLYFMTRTENPLPGGDFEYRLFKSSAGTVSEVFFSSAKFSGAYELAVYRDHLYLPVFRDDHYAIYKYDGSTFTEFLSLPEGAYNSQITLRQGKLVIIPKTGTSVHSYEYNGSVFTEITTPGGENMFKSEESTACFHVWLVGGEDLKDHKYRNAFAIERFNDSCVPDDDEPVIPKLLTDYEHILITDIGKERDWCWTGIDVDWEIDPICPVLPCHDPAFGTTLRDKNGKIAWQKTFDKPFSTSIPITDTQPFALSLSVENNKVLNDVLIFDKDLVNKGIENLALDMYPKQAYFYLTVSTDKNVQVPFTMTLKNTQGQSLWQGNYTAPMDQLVYAFVPKAGDYLQFSLPNTNASSVSYFPNPFSGRLNVSIPAANQNVRITISDFNGTVVADQKFSHAGNYTIDVSDQKAGLFVLTIIEGGSVRKELVQITK